MSQWLTLRTVDIVLKHRRFVHGREVPSGEDVEQRRLAAGTVAPVASNASASLCPPSRRNPSPRCTYSSTSLRWTVLDPPQRAGMVSAAASRQRARERVDRSCSWTERVASRVVSSAGRTAYSYTSEGRWRGLGRRRRRVTRTQRCSPGTLEDRGSGIAGPVVAWRRRYARGAGVWC